MTDTNTLPQRARSRHSSERQRLAAREWAEQVRGWEGRAGGWIYNGSGRSIMQGWSTIYRSYRREIVQWYVQRLTVFDSLGMLVETPRNYRPTLAVGGRGGWRYAFLADEYDATQYARHDPRRAYRGSDE